jgi:hypothetical protein
VTTSSGPGGEDTVYGEIGNHQIFTSEGDRDNVYAGDGNDTIYIYGGSRRAGQVDVYDGGPGTDTVVVYQDCSGSSALDPLDTFQNIEAYQSRITVC